MTLNHHILPAANPSARLSGWRLLAVWVLICATAACGTEEQLPEAPALAGESIGDLATSPDIRCGHHLEQGENQLARAVCEEAVEQARRDANPRLEASALSKLGQAWHASGDLQRALELYGQSRDLATAVGARDLATAAGHNLAVLFGSVGRYDDAAEQLRRVVSQHAPGPERAVSTMTFGLALVDSGRLQEGLATYHQALQRLRASGQTAYLALTHDLRGKLLLQLGRPEEALAQHQLALRLIRETDAVPIKAHIHLSLGLHYQQRGDCAAARQSLRHARQLFTEQGNDAAVAEGVPAEARCLASQGHWQEAEGILNEAMEKIEAMRARLAQPSMRGDYLGSRFGIFGTAVELAMERHRAEPGAGHDERAFELAEGARARTLLDQRVRVEQRSRWRSDSEEGRLRQRLSELENRQLRAQLAGREPAAELNQRIEQLYQRIDRLTGPLPLTTPPLDLATIQAEILEPGTVLLSFLLGSERSHLWWIEHNDLHSFELPGVEIIDRLARQVHRSLASPADAAGADQRELDLRDLSGLLLGPVAERLAGQRLLVAADGALHYLPFAVLAHPLTGEPLVMEHEVVHLPAASLLVAQRRRLVDRSPAKGWLAAIGDAVFDADDPRLSAAGAGVVVPGTEETATASRALAGLGIAGLRRLPFSGREVEAIGKSGKREDEVLPATGFAATRELLLGGGVRGFRIIHLATHGVFDTSHPERSGLVFSLFDRQGRPIDGLVQAHDITDLDLPAELIVLSACRTALGKEVRGEGLMGLTQAFFQAGAARLIVSFWRIPDRSTAELMGRFYRHLGEGGLAPGAALQQAQRSMYQEGYAPHQWASMALIGDWRAFE